MRAPPSVAGELLRSDKSLRSGRRERLHELAGDPPGLGVGVGQRVERVDLSARAAPRASPRSPRRSRGSRSRPSRNACTATSLAAFSVHGAVPPAIPASRARRRQANVSVSTGSNVSAPELGEIERPDRNVDALGVVQAVGDRHPHVRIAEMGQRRAVAQLDQAVDDRLRVHDHVDLVIRRPEQVMGLDQLQALVHQRRRVDRDLAAHRPRGMGERLLDRHVGELVGRPAAEGATGGGEDQPVDRARPLGRRAADGAPSARSRPG